MNRLLKSVLSLLFTALAVCAVQAQTCDDWKNVKGWQGTYTLTADGQFVYHIIDLYTIEETSGATVSMPSMTGGLCTQLRWQGADLHNTGSANDSTQVLNGCTQGQYFLSDTLVGYDGYPSDSEIVIDATDGTFSFQPISHVLATHTVFNCEGSQSQDIEWATTPATNWPLTFPLPGSVGPLTVNDFHFTAANRYAGYQDVAWTLTFNLTPILADSDQALNVTVNGSGSVTSADGIIHCPGVCNHAYPENTQVTLNAAPDLGSTFVTWSGACSGTGPCTISMTQPLSVTAVFSGPLQFVAVTPCRIVETRDANGPFGGPPIAGGHFRSFDIPHKIGCGIPTTAATYSLNVTAVPRGPLGYLTIWPTDQNQPNVSILNSVDGRTKANAAIVPAGTDGAVSVFASNTTDLVLDIDGFFAPPGALPGQQTYQFYTLTPCRVLDTRNPDGSLGGPFLTGQVRRDFPVLASDCNIPSSAQAYSLNLTVVPHPAGEPLGYLTVWPQGESQPTVSTLNNPTATTVANAAIVPAGTGGGISVFSSNDTDLVADINGYFAAPGGANGLSLYPAAPCRVIDTRDNHGQPFTGEKTINVAGSGCAPPSAAQAYGLNATVVPSGPLGYLTLWPNGENQPVVSTLNALDAFITSNMAIVPTTDGSIDAFASSLTQLVLDISSYFAP